MNMANANAAELFAWIKLDVSLWESKPMKAKSIAPLCRRRLWGEKRNYDPALPAYENGRVIFCGRRENYLRQQTALLLAVCERAMDLNAEAEIYWG